MTRRIVTAFAALALTGSAFADISGTATVNAPGNFNFDTGQNVSSGGDISYNGGNINFIGTAKGGSLTVAGITGTAGYGSINQTILQGLASAGLATSTPISSASLSAGTSSGSVIAVLTNGGHSAKLLVTALSTTSITFQYTTYGAAGSGGGGGGPSAPAVTAVLNNSSTIPAGFPNSGVAPSSLIVIKGSGMADPNAQAVLQDSAKGLPTTLNGASVSVSAGGKNYPLGIYYAIATQIAAVLPAAVPPGPATLTATYNGTPGAPMSFNVVQSAYGISNYSGNTAVVQDALSGALITPTASGKPGQIVVLWGTGLGSDPADSDTTYTSSPHQINTPLQIYVGGVQVSSIAYVGASVYPGVHVIGFTLPQGVPNGCYIPVIVVTGNNVVSNTPTIPIMSNGGVCSDPSLNINGTTISNLSGQTTTRTGHVLVGQLVGSGRTTNIAEASFSRDTYSSGRLSGGSPVSIGSCSITQTGTDNGGGSTSVGLDAGAITMTGPAGTYNLQAVPALTGTYLAQLPSGAIPSSGGTFTFNASGGADVGSFTTNVTFPSPLLTWTNQSAAAMVNRAQGLLFTWNGGAPGSLVFMSGSSSANGVTGSFLCYAPQSALQFMVPSYVTGILPAGQGTTFIENLANYDIFTARGLDLGTSLGFTGVSVTSTYQ